jgi:hypothetical protein
MIVYYAHVIFNFEINALFGTLRHKKINCVFLLLAHIVHTMPTPTDYATLDDYIHLKAIFCRQKDIYIIYIMEKNLTFQL